MIHLMLALCVCVCVFFSPFFCGWGCGRWSGIFREKGKVRFQRQIAVFEIIRSVGGGFKDFC